MNSFLSVLDLDETLFHATEIPLANIPADFVIAGFHCYTRPHLHEFLTNLSTISEIAIWSSASEGYVSAMVPMLVPASIKPAFVWARPKCTVRYDEHSAQYHFVKKLRKIESLGFSLQRTIVVDDSPEKVRENFGNAVYVTPFEGDRSDIELRVLLPFIQSLKNIPDVRKLEKRNWRQDFA